MSTAELLLIKRKERLQRLFKKESGGLRYSDNVGPRFSAKPAGSVLEGAISTQADRPYVPGDRGIRVVSIARSSLSLAGQTQRAAARTQGGLSRCVLAHCE